MNTAQTIKKILVTTATVGLLAGLGASFLLSNAGAQESPRILTIVPPSKELHLNPGDKSEGDLKLINDSEQTMTFTASAQDFIVEAKGLSADAFISGEVSERTYYQAKELGIHYYSCGHHATERFGIQSLGQHLAQSLDLEWAFFDSANPI